MITYAPDQFFSQEADLSEDLYPWEDLIVFKPTKGLRQELWRRTTGGHFQFIEDGWGDLSCDYYPIQIDSMPRITGKSMNAEQLLLHIRRNLNAFIDTSNSRFRPYGFDSRTKRHNRILWRGKSPKGALVHIAIHLGLGGFNVNVEDATVMVTQSSNRKWVFSTVFTPKLFRAGNGAHPINGNREFAIRSNGDGSYLVWTRAADRVNSFFERSANFLNIVAEGQDELWRSFQAGVASFVNKNHGSARPRKATIQRFDWDRVRASLKERYCTAPLEFEEEAHKGCIRTSGLIGKLYRIRRGDTLLGVAGKVYGVGPSKERLRLAQLINDHPYNQRFWRASLASSWFPQGRISFNPRFSCSFRSQQNAFKGSAPFGRCYATILIPPRPRNLKT